MNTNTIRAIFSLKVVLPALVVILAAVGAYAMVKSAPKAMKRPPVATAPTVETLVLSKEDHRIWVPVMGTVTAAREITLEARVSGEVATVSPTFVPGGFFEKDAEILRLDPEDYQLALSEVQADVTTAEYNLKVEQGYQNVSAREWELLKGDTKGTEAEASLALRKPHLQKAKADLAAAKAKLRQAKLDLDRTRVTAPFAAMVQEKSTDIGATVSEQEALATLVGTEEFWVQASIPVDRLDRIEIPSVNQENGSVVRILSGSGTSKTIREGRVVRLLPSLEDEGRMARLLISVKDPLNLEGVDGVKPLLLGSYVSVQIDGGRMEGVYAIPRTAYRDNGKVWVLGDGGTLEIRSLTPVWRSEDTIFFAEGLTPGEAVVTSGLTAPLEGMKLRAAGKPTSVSEQASQEREPLEIGDAS